MQKLLRVWNWSWTALRVDFLIICVVELNTHMHKHKGTFGGSGHLSVLIPRKFLDTQVIDTAVIVMANILYRSYALKLWAGGSYLVQLVCINIKPHISQSRVENGMASWHCCLWKMSFNCWAGAGKSLEVCNLSIFQVAYFSTWLSRLPRLKQQSGLFFY